jgi:hypothetical protein
MVRVNVAVYGSGVPGFLALLTGLLPCGKLRGLKGRFAVLGKSFMSQSRAFLFRLYTGVLFSMYQV